MIRSRRLYGVMLVMTAIFFLMFSSLFFLILLLLELLLIIVLHMMLHKDAGQISVRLHTKAACMAGQDTTVSLQLVLPGGMHATGIIAGELCYENVLFNAQKIEPFEIHLNNDLVNFAVTFTPDFCGVIHIHWQKAVCYDLLGLCKVKLPEPGECVITVHPSQHDLEVLLKQNSIGYQEGEQQEMDQKGMDFSEVFDLREYYPGDDIRSIHWKLTSKLDKVILREGSDTTHLHIALMFDAGLASGEIVWDKRILEAGMEFLLSASASLLQQGISHDVCIPGKNGLYTAHINEQSDFAKMTAMWMSMALLSECGMGLRYFEIDNLQEQYMKMLYVTAGDYPETLSLMGNRLNLTAVCIRETGEQMGVMNRGQIQMINMPMHILKEKRNTIFI